MSFKKYYTPIKKNALSILMIGFFILLAVSPNAKSWMLQQLLTVGLFKAEIKNKDAKNLPANISFSFTDSEGVEANTAGLKGKVVLINFWASWCPPCRAEMPSLDALYQKFKNDNRIVFLIINEDEDRSKAIQYFEKNNFALPIFYTPGTVPNEIFSGTLPTTIIINKEGTIVYKHEGMADYNSAAFTNDLKDLL
ncbi:MAG: TlpA disulfide reductase family protein [Ginsengibacter sp.]